MLPNLSRLTLHTDVTLFDHLSQNKNGKKPGCFKDAPPPFYVDEPTKPPEDAKQSEKDAYRQLEEEYRDYQKALAQDQEENCFYDGYLMYKQATEQATPITEAPDFTDKVINVSVPLNDATVEVNLTPLTPSGDDSQKSTARFKNFASKHQNWITRPKKSTKPTFERVCDRGKKLGSVEWSEYGEELTAMTDWYFLDDEQERGHLFLQLFADDDKKNRFKMPANGVFEGRYLYVVLVCANSKKGPGYGKFLMKVVEAVSTKLSCRGVALSTLSNSAGFYYSLGYRFFDRENGEIIDVARWTTTVQQPDGRMKIMLDNDTTYASSSSSKKRVRDQNNKKNDEKNDENNNKCTYENKNNESMENLPDDPEVLESMFQSALKRARMLYTRLLGLSQADL